jgi:hypothetical protein
MNPLDELFKHKLEDHSLPPSPLAWSKVERAISKKNRTIVWLRVAACLAFLGLGWVMYQQIENAPSKSVMVVYKPIIKKEDEKNTAIPHGKITNTISTKAKLVETKATSLATTQAVVAEQNSLNEVTTTNEMVALETTIEEGATEYKEVIAQAEKPLVIEYTLEPVKDQPQEVTSRSKLQKMVDFALEAKHSDGALTNLRQAKDDLFAFNFKKDKSKPIKN